MNLSLRAIRYFVTAAELGSISKAAHILSISNSAIAAAIDAVEIEFNDQFVIRERSKGLTLTASGRAILKRARYFLEEYNAFLSDGLKQGAEITGNLSIGYFAPVAPAFLPEILEPIIKQGTDLNIKIEACNNAVAQSGLRNGLFDVILFMDYAVHPDIQQHMLIEIPPYLIVPADHPLGSRAQATFSDLADETIILLDLPMTLDYYNTLLKHYDLRPNVVAGANNVEMVRSMVAAGLGVSILNMRPRTATAYSGAEIACVPLVTEVEQKLSLVLGSLPGQKRRIVREFITRCETFFASTEANNLAVRNRNLTTADGPR